MKKRAMLIHMKRFATLLFGLFLLAGAAPNAQDRPAYVLENGQRHADAPEQVIVPGGGDDWQPQPLYQLPPGGDRFWIRFEVDLVSESLSGLYLNSLYSYRLYWDGLLIGENGRVGASASEDKPGLMERTFSLPAHLATPGRHTVLLHISRNKLDWTPSALTYDFMLGDFERLVQSRTKNGFLPLMSFSAIGLIGLFSLFLAVQHTRNRAAGYFGALCLFIAALMLAESWRELFNYSYDWHHIRLILILVLTGSVGLLLPTFLLRFFEMPGKAIISALSVTFIGVSLALDSFDMRSLLILALSLGCSLVIAIRAFYGYRPFALLFIGALVLCLLGLVIAPFWFADTGFFLSFNLLVLVFLFSLARTFKALERAETNAQIEKARLELELLKKHMNPHFLMNVLNAISDWIELEPKTAVRFIEALGHQFRTLIALSDRRLVDLEEELALCRSFVEVMAFREDRQSRLSVDGPTAGLQIPPGVIHTMLENGFSHSNTSAAELDFHLHVDQQNETACLTFTAPFGKAAKSQEHSDGHGTGDRFILSSLRTAFGPTAALSSWQREDKWIYQAKWQK